MKSPQDNNFLYPAATESASGNWLQSKIKHDLGLSFD